MLKGSLRILIIRIYKRTLASQTFNQFPSNQFLHIFVFSKISYFQLSA